MNKYIAGIFFASAMAGALSSCTTPETGSKIVINEVLVDNQSNFQDDYGVHSGWVEIFNTSYNSVNLAGCYLKVSSEPGDTVSYFIPKGDNWVGLYDSGRKLLDEVVVPAGILKTDQSYARISDGSDEWEVKDDSETKYVTPSTNNQTLEGNPKMDKFELHDAAGLGMTITAMTVVFIGLILLYISFRIIGKIAVKLRKRNAMKAHNITDKQEAKERRLGEAPGDVIAAIAMALHEAQGSDHDVEETILTISRVKRSYSPWSSKIYTLRENPHKK